MKMFDEWNISKKNLQVNKKPVIKFNARDVWWCSYGVNLGSEQDGVGNNFERLCLVVRKLSPTTFIALPISTKEKLEMFQVEVIIKNVKGFILLDQVRVIDVKRLLRKVSYVSKEEFEVVRNRLKSLI